MPRTMQFTKFGHTVSFELPLYDEANATAREYAYFYGWRQALQDAYANTKTASEMEGACQKKFDKIVSGQLKFRFDGSAPRKSELETEMDLLAEARVLKAAAAKNIKLTKVRVAEYVVGYLARPVMFEELRIEAQGIINRRAELAAKNEDLLGDDFFADMK